MDKDEIITQLESMPLEQARREIAAGKFGDPTTIVHNFASFWLSTKEAEERDRRDLETISISRKALSVSREAKTIAIIAIVLSATIAIAAIIIPLLAKN